MKYLLYKDGAGFAKYKPNDGSISHTLDYLHADEACLSDWSDVLAFDFGDYHQIVCAGSVEKLQRFAAMPNDQKLSHRRTDVWQTQRFPTNRSANRRLAPALC